MGQAMLNKLRCCAIAWFMLTAITGCTEDQVIVTTPRPNPTESNENGNGGGNNNNGGGDGGGVVVGPPPTSADPSDEALVLQLTLDNDKQGSQ